MLMTLDATAVGLLQYGKVQSDNKKSSTQKTGETYFIECKVGLR